MTHMGIELLIHLKSTTSYRKHRSWLGNAQPGLQECCRSVSRTAYGSGLLPTREVNFPLLDSLVAVCFIHEGDAFLRRRKRYAQRAGLTSLHCHDNTSDSVCKVSPGQHS